MNIYVGNVMMYVDKLVIKCNGNVVMIFICCNNMSLWVKEVFVVIVVGIVGINNGIIVVVGIFNFVDII